MKKKDGECKKNKVVIKDSIGNCHRATNSNTKRDCSRVVITNEVAPPPPPKSSSNKKEEK